jgi:hypothetical protein
MTDLYENCKPIDPVLCELETVECTCGYHMGVDATYLDQVGTAKIPCPSCGRMLVILGFE